MPVSLRVIGPEDLERSLRDRLSLLQPSEEVSVLFDRPAEMLKVSSPNTRIRVRPESAYVSTKGRISEDAVAAVSVVLPELGVREPVERFLSSVVDVGRTVPRDRELVAVVKGRDAVLKFRAEPDRGGYALESRGNVLIRRTRSTCEIEVLTTVGGVETLARRAQRIWRQLSLLSGGEEAGNVITEVLRAVGR